MSGTLDLFYDSFFRDALLDKIEEAMILTNCAKAGTLFLLCCVGCRQLSK
ncbi:hypothetical protein X729_31010 [Mesorhizobium sp. L103C131B0]|nr:hypothetical protein X729_31010 [Mesorhizobium sp. L103C131B0]